jgi:Glycosyltransferase family 87
MAGSVWFYVQRILIPYQIADAAAHQRPRGVLSDLYPRWLGTRELLLHHRDPYSPEVTRDIQIGYYGRPLDPTRPDDPKDEERFAYPVYVVFLLAPVAQMPFAPVRIAFAVLLAILTAVSVILWLYFLGWRLSPVTSATILVFSMGSFATLQGIKLQQLSLLVAGIIASAAALLAGGHLFAAGFLLAVATIKPQLVLLLVAWLLLWSISGWHERRTFFWGFIIGMLFLVAAGEYVLPGWISRFADAVAAYRRYTDNSSPVDTLTTPRMGALLTIALLSITVAVCWQCRNRPAHSSAFQLVTALMLTIILLIAPTKAPYNQVLLLPGVFLILRGWNQLWKKNIWSRTFCILVIVLFSWPWVSSFFLMLGSIFLPPSTVQRAWAVPLWTSIALPLVVLGLLAPLASEAWRSRTA